MVRQRVTAPVRVYSDTPTVTAGAYSANDALGGVLEFANVTEQAGDGGVIVNVTIRNLVATAPQIDVVFFDSEPTGVADNGPYDLPDADLAMAIGWVKVATTDWTSFSDSALACVDNVGLAFKLDGTTLYAQMIDRTGTTLSGTSDITVLVGIAAE